MLLKQSTARNRVILMVDSTDHLTGKTGLTLTITASKNGAALASISPTVTELANGLYSLALTTGNTDTVGDLVLHITGTAADPTDVADQVCVGLPGDLTHVLGTLLSESAAGRLAAALQAFLNVATPVLTVASVNQTGDSFARLGAPATASIASDIDAVPTAVENADALLKRDWTAVTGEASRSVLNALRVLRNAWTVIAGIYAVKKEDDSTNAWTSTIGSNAAADPIVSSDPT